MVLKPLIVIHRWLGVVLCVLFLLWFPSGIGMIYWGMPAVSTQDRLDRMPSLDPAAITLSPEEAAKKIGEIGQNASPSQIRLSSFDGRPVYRFGGDSGRIVYADNGDEHTQADQVMRDRVAALASSLRGQVRMKDFVALGPKEVLTRFPDLKIKELSYTSYNSQPLYSATLDDGSSRLIALDGRAVDEFNREEIIGIVKKSVPNPDKLEIRILEQYDAYYQDRDRRRPLPVILALTGDTEATRYYIDPKTASVVGNYSNRNWVNRWLYHGLHSLNFPFLYNHRPLWDIVVITFMVGGTALSMTSLILAWRAIGKKLREVVAVRQSVPRKSVVST